MHTRNLPLECVFAWMICVGERANGMVGEIVCGISRAKCTHDYEIPFQTFWFGVFYFGCLVSHKHTDLLVVFVAIAFHSKSKQGKQQWVSSIQSLA